MHWFMFHKSGFKSTHIVLLHPNMKGLMKDLMKIYQTDIPMSIGYAYWGVYLWTSPDITLWSIQPRGASHLLQIIPSTKISTINNGGSFTMVRLTKINYQVNLIRVLGPCFTVVCKMKLIYDCWMCK